MKYVFQVNHPAHYHLIKNICSSLKANGHIVSIVARGKDVLESLLEEEDYILLKTKKGKNLIEKIARKKTTENELIQTIVSLNPDFVIGTGPFDKVTGINGIKTIFLSEDDVIASPMLFLSAVLGYSNFSDILSPSVCNNLLWNNKTIHYSSYHELAYLHPSNFTPDKNIVNQYFPYSKPYFIIRFAKLNAYHDIGKRGIDTDIASKIIDKLKKYGDIYITSERELEPQFEKYRININPLDMHHVMAFAQMYIGDSQTMAAEAGVLGVPFIRFNDFVGRIGYLKELEDDYKLGFGIKTKDANQLYQKVDELLKMPNRKNVFQQRRQKMLSEKIDYAKFLTWFIENYPESRKTMKENPDYQYNFR